ncbi:30S ribosomal protein S16 [Candidatus Wolfebacteria bacterium]|nr:30S ribosomal protein S16 [Candidatus Wolfebacteria bacterium]
MMLAIKFKRIGKKHQPSYRIVVNEKRSKMSGRFVEDIGWYNPSSKEFKVDKERVLYRIKTGAQPTDSVYNLLVRAKVIEGKKRPAHKIVKKLEEKPAEQNAVAA